MTHDRPPTLHRRGLLASLGAAGLAAAVPAAQAATPELPLTAATTEGPYYFDARKVRSDITEGLEGVSLEVRLVVLAVHGQPLSGLRVDIWHCDAQGRYSGYAGQGDDRRLSMQGETFLRGGQPTARDGGATFRTIYPGWYAGRTTHIHLKVLDGTRAVLTSQFFLPDALSEFLYTQLSQYRRASLRDTLNSSDGIALQAGGTTIGAVREEGRQYVATLTLVVDPAASPAIDRPPFPGEHPPRGMSGTPGPGRPQVLQGSARTAALIPSARR